MFVARRCYFYENPNLGTQKSQQLLKEDFVKKMVDIYYTFQKQSSSV